MPNFNTKKACDQFLERIDIDVGKSMCDIVNAFLAIEKSHGIELPIANFDNLVKYNHTRLNSGIFRNSTRIKLCKIIWLNLL